MTVAAVVVALLASGCSRSDARPPSRTVPTERTTSTSTTTLEQSYAVPDVIDAAYVNRVLAALEHVAGDVVRKIHATREFAEEDLVPLRAIYNDPEFEIQAEGHARLVTGDPAKRHDPPGDQLTTARRVVRLSDDCMYVEVEVSLAQILKEAPPPRRAYLEIRLSQPGSDPSGLNPTPWSVADEDPTEEQKCVS